MVKYARAMRLEIGEEQKVEIYENFFQRFEHYNASQNEIKKMT